LTGIDEESAMFKTDAKLEELIMIAVSLVVTLASLAVIAWTLFTGQIGEQGLDALFMITICLLMVVVFGAIPFSAWRKGTFKNLLKRSQPASAKTEVVTPQASKAETSA
jgi:hypothetical protein